MKYEVDGWNNFCRVFLMPPGFPEGYCFGGGHPVNFNMVDWFSPVEDVQMAGCTKDVWEKNIGEIKTTVVDHTELVEKLSPWLVMKRYVKPGMKYLVICDFGLCFVFQAPEEKP